MHQDIYLVSYLLRLQPVYATVAASSAIQAQRLVQCDARTHGAEPLELLVEMICPGDLLTAP
jgi:hypothetical protein